MAPRSLRIRAQPATITPKPIALAAAQSIAAPDAPERLESPGAFASRLFPSAPATISAPPIHWP